MKVLLVEDDPMIGAAIQMALQDAAYAVDWTHDGEAALAALGTQSYDVMLLDVGLPRCSGLEVLRQIRQSQNALPVLLVTARDAVSDRIAGLDLGADDYVVKPFEMGELLARMRAVVRRKAGNASPILSNGVLFLDPSLREVKIGEGQAEDKTVRLSAREFSLLQALLLRPGAILSREELENRIYGWNEEVESNAVEFLIHSLRKKLGATAIKNIRGMGWMVAKAH